MKKFRKREGRCYELSGQHLLFDQKEFKGWYLVHGVYRWPPGPPEDESIDIDHAWLEDDLHVFDPVKAEYFTKQSFYKDFDVRNVRRYTLKDAAKMIRQHSHWGPWNSLSKTSKAQERGTKP